MTKEEAAGAEPDYTEMDRDAGEAARASEKRKQVTTERERKRMAGALLTLLPKRDLEILEWVCRSSGKLPGEVATQMIHEALVKERIAFREAHGGGGASSTDAQKLSARLSGR